MRGKWGESLDPHAVRGSTAASGFNLPIGGLVFVLKPAPRKHLLGERVRIFRSFFVDVWWDVLGRDSEGIIFLRGLDLCVRGRDL